MKQATLTDLAAPVLALLNAKDSERAFDDAKVIEVYAAQGDVDGLLLSMEWASADYPNDVRLAGAIDAVSVIALAVAAA